MNKHYWKHNDRRRMRRARHQGHHGGAMRAFERSFNRAMRVWWNSRYFGLQGKAFELWWERHGKAASE